ncbi:MAG: tetratricopeptide repeat protein [Alphaproteobacteria bacterium]|jgi:predicted O-linked N-acetylglucosamine transferase (SPINDLY family)|nr:tetratricopeptide repeat protein [Alphaproteobacteria bacterium]
MHGSEESLGEASAEAIKDVALRRLAAGDLAAAYEGLARAAAAEPEDPEAAFHLGTLMLRLDQPEAAVSHLNRALALAPAVTAVHNNLATALLQLDDAESAANVAKLGLEAAPEVPELHNTLGNALVKLGRAEDAAAHYAEAWRLAPAMPGAAINLANIFADLGLAADARKIYEAVLETHPGLADAHLGLARLAERQGAIETAEAELRRALAAEPGHLGAKNELGILLMAAGRWNDALAIFRDLSQLHPELGEARLNMGQALQALGRHDEAVAAFDAVSPSAGAAPFLLQSLMQQCAWDRVDALEGELLSSLQETLARDDEVRVPPFVLAPTSASAELRAAAAEAFSARLEREALKGATSLAFAHRREARARLRVGFVSPDFRRHSVGLAMADLVAALDRDGFEWFAYSTARDPGDDLTAEFRRHFDGFRELTGHGVVEAARRIYDDGIDVAVDLAGHTRNSGLEILALKPAPVQAHYLGYGATLGAPWVPYLITDPAHTPAALAQVCPEAMVYLPDSFMAASRPRDIRAAPSRAAVGLPEAGIVFANFNAHYKLHPGLFAVWMRLLCDCPGSVLWLKAGSEAAEANLRREAAARGVAPERLVFAERRPHEAHLARHRLADMALDCHPHAGGVTTLDALAAGVPVLSLAGEAHASRTGASILAAIGMAELVTDSLDAYETQARHLAAEPGRLAELKTRLAGAAATAPLYRPARLARHLECAFRTMWQHWTEGRRPESFHVPPLD